MLYGICRNVGIHHPKKCETWQRYYPGLPEECYKYHPVINSSREFSDIYGNGGFPDHTEIEVDGKKQPYQEFICILVM